MSIVKPRIDLVGFPALEIHAWLSLTHAMFNIRPDVLQEIEEYINLRGSWMLPKNFLKYSQAEFLHYIKLYFYDLMRSEEGCNLRATDHWLMENGSILVTKLEFTYSPLKIWHWKIMTIRELDKAFDDYLTKHGRLNPPIMNGDNYIL